MKTMIFLIQYNRNRRELIEFQRFDDSEREKAYDAKLALELRLNGQRTRDEVMILEASSEAAVRRTHRRYFETLEQLLTAPG